MGRVRRIFRMRGRVRPRRSRRITDHQHRNGRDILTAAPVETDRTRTSVFKAPLSTDSPSIPKLSGLHNRPAFSSLSLIDAAKREAGSVPLELALPDMSAADLVPGSYLFARPIGEIAGTNTVFMSAAGEGPGAKRKKPAGDGNSSNGELIVPTLTRPAAVKKKRPNILIRFLRLLVRGYKSFVGRQESTTKIGEWRLKPVSESDSAELEAMLADVDRVQQMSLKQLQLMAEKYAPELMNKDVAIRLIAVQILTEIVARLGVSHSKQYLSQIMVMLTDSNYMVRSQALYGIIKSIHSTGEDTFPISFEEIQDTILRGRPEVKTAGILILKEMIRKLEKQIEDIQPYVDAISNFLSDLDRGVRLTAVWALGRVLEESGNRIQNPQSYVSKIESLADHSSPDIQREAEKIVDFLSDKGTKVNQASRLRAADLDD